MDPGSNSSRGSLVTLHTLGYPHHSAVASRPRARQSLVAAAREALVGATSSRPLVLLLDDLHWVDPASIDLLRALARQVAAFPMLLLVTYRADEVTRGHPLYTLLPVLVREARIARLTLRPLDLQGVAALVAARYPLLGADAGRLVTYLDRRAEGNPFFIGELLYALEESGLLRPPGVGERVWALGDLAQAHLSSLVRQVIDGRAARLGEAARGLLAVAAAIGQDVPLRLWAAVAVAEEDALPPVVEAALEARLLLARMIDRAGALRPRARPRGPLRGHPAAAPRAPAPTDRRGPGRRARPRPRRRRVPLPARRRRASGRVACPGGGPRLRRLGVAVGGPALRGRAGTAGRGGWPGGARLAAFPPRADAPVRRSPAVAPGSR